MNHAVGVVGGGLVGSGWAIVFARAGYEVRIYDAAEEIRRKLPAQIMDNLQGLESWSLIDDAAAAYERIQIVDTLNAAITGVTYVQESVLERTDVKRQLYEELDTIIDATVPVGSSSSGIPASAFTEGLVHNQNYLIAHPVNPPYLVPLVELVPAPWTSPSVVEQVSGIMRDVGQIPIHVRREVEGFILNRLQGALLREAWALYEEGYASTADIDRTISHGLGLRWSFMGPFETIDLNAPGGVRDYAERLGSLYHSIACDRTDPQPWNDELVTAVEGERREALKLDQLPQRCSWRDRQLMALVAHKRKQGLVPTEPDVDDE